MATMKRSGVMKRRLSEDGRNEVGGCWGSVVIHGKVLN